MFRISTFRKFELLLLVTIILTSLWGRAIFEAKTAQKEGDAFFAEKLPIEAIKAYTKSSSWQAPFFSPAIASGRRAFEISIEQVEDPAEKLLHLRALRSALLGSRNFFNARKDSEVTLLLNQIDQILEVLAPSNPSAAREAKSPRVDYGFQAVAQGCFWGWIASILLTIFWGFDKTGKVIGANFLRGSATSFVFYLAWLLALRFA